MYSISDGEGFEGGNGGYNHGGGGANGYSRGREGGWI